MCFRDSRWAISVHTSWSDSPGGFHLSPYLASTFCIEPNTGSDLAPPQFYRMAGKGPASPKAAGASGASP